jgi:hypothetical protein
MKAQGVLRYCLTIFELGTRWKWQINVPVVLPLESRIQYPGTGYSWVLLPQVGGLAHTINMPTNNP